ncbi:hypothetical protein Tco_1314453 [Tanacetum coccineum]
MSTLTFADTHNMVAFLEKPAESDGFHEIIDFLNANQIHYALIVNPTIYTSCIEQFWATTKVKTVNSERQLQALVDKKKLGDMSHHKKIYVNPSHTKKIFANMKREGKDFFGRVTPLFATMMIQASQEEGVDSVPHPSDSTADIPNEESVSTHSNDPLLNEKKAGLRTHKFKRLYKVGVTRRVHFLYDDSLSAQEDASNQGRSIEDIDKDVKVSLVDETWGRTNDAEMFDTDALFEVGTIAPSTTVVPPPSHVITKVEITLAQTLAKLKSVKSKVVIQEPVQSTATTAPSTIPKAKGITFRDADERTPTSVSSLRIKDKGKAKMDEPEVPLKKKDQIALNEEIAKNLKAQLQAELIKEERLARKKEEEANIVLIES